jgi:hypothetical protein
MQMLLLSDSATTVMKQGQIVVPCSLIVVQDTSNELLTTSSVRWKMPLLLYLPLIFADPK